MSEAQQPRRGRTEQRLCFRTLQARGQSSLQGQELCEICLAVPSQLISGWIPVSLCWIHLKSLQISLGIRNFLSVF